MAEYYTIIAYNYCNADDIELIGIYSSKNKAIDKILGEFEKEFNSMDDNEKKFVSNKWFNKRWDGDFKIRLRNRLTDDNKNRTTKLHAHDWWRIYHCKVDNFTIMYDREIWREEPDYNRHDSSDSD